jgi:hypothetical protein
VLSQEVDALGGERRGYRQRCYQPCMPAHPCVHLIQVKGDDTAAYQVGQVAQGILLTAAAAMTAARLVRNC